MSTAYRASFIVAALLALAGAAQAADVATQVQSCAACHGKDGVSTESDVPTIAGLSAPFLEHNLSSYARKERACPDTKIKSGPRKGTSTNMCEVALSLGDASGVAKYFADRKFVRAAQSFDPELARRGKAIHQQNCEKCHSADGTDPKDDAGILAGQWAPYLRSTLDEFAAGKRPIEQKMKPRIQKLDQAGFDALVNYYASFK